MGLIRRNIIVLLFITVTLIFSLVGFNPQEVVIGGPYFPQIEYFEEELALISKELNIKISYVPVSDIETQIIKEENYLLLKVKDLFYIQREEKNF